jgi:similar to stage IV sporulation protein
LQNKILYSISGYLILRIEGDCAERFFNVCRAHGIELWSISQKDQKCICRIYASDFIKIKPIVKKTNTKVKVLDKKGLPFYIPVLKRYSALIVLFCAIIFLLIYSHNFIWAVEYVGNLQISDDELNDFLVSENIYYGIKKDNIDCNKEEKNIRDTFPNIIWTSVYFEGTKLFVSLKENDKSEPKTPQRVGSDIVSEDDGTITSMLIRNGVAMVKVGDNVEKGQMLISGSVPIYNEEQEIIDYQIYDADADIYIQTTYEYNNSIDNTYYVIYYTGNNIKSYFLQIFGYDFSNLRLNKFFREKRNMRYETITSRTQLRLPKNFYLPVYYGEINRKEYYIKYLTYTEDELMNKLTDDFEKIILDMEKKGIKIVEKNVEMVQNKNSMELNGNLTIIKKTGVSNLQDMTIKE